MGSISELSAGHQRAVRVAKAHPRPWGCLFADRLVPVSVEAAEEWGHIDADRPVSMADGLIAATAKVRGWTVVTRNIKDFDATGVRLLNPFTG